MGDLITLTRATVNLPEYSSTTALNETLSKLIGAASRQVQRFCRRDFLQTEYDELYETSIADTCILLKQFPVLSVKSLRHGLDTVLKVQNTSTSTNQIARVSVTDTGISLYRVASGTVTTDATVLFATYTTLGTVASAITALGNGWTAEAAADLSNYPSAELRKRPAVNARGRWAEIKAHVDEWDDFELEEETGKLMPVGYDDGHWDERDLSTMSWRVQYTAGYATVPEDVQEAVAQLAISYYRDLGRNTVLGGQNSGGVSQSVLPDGRALLPRSIRALLTPYRNFRV